jgi:hypothetical protein
MVWTVDSGHDDEVIAVCRDSKVVVFGPGDVIHVLAADEN